MHETIEVVWANVASAVYHFAMVILQGRTFNEVSEIQRLLLTVMKQLYAQLVRCGLHIMGPISVSPVKWPHLLNLEAVLYRNENGNHVQRTYTGKSDLCIDAVYTKSKL